MADRMSAAEYRALIAKGGKNRRNKYHAVPAYRCDSCAAALPWGGAKCHACGSDYSIRFDSTAEAKRYDQLVILQRAGQITDLKRQVPFPIHIEGQKTAAYLADFTYTDSEGRQHVEDVKSPATMTPLARLKIKQVEAQYGITVEIVR